ncbi:DUF192 domain-containing protein [Halobacterium yunchengense]|uniref:DUF192 domain-containing protein n=1 Tax=Halobacterium yunchengense TaxID=3108497 RepID=UPI00300A4922
MVRRVLAVACLVVVAGCTGFGVDGDGATTEPTVTTTTPTAEPTTEATSDAATTVERPRVVVLDETDERLGAVTVELAENASERYTGLSEHDSLGANEGMLFVYGGEDERTYVMRNMSFDIDMVFVGADGRINEIHHATVEADDDDLTGYEGSAKWVLEVPYDWTTEHGVEVGDRIRVER